MSERGTPLPDDKAKRILIYRPGSLGDTLIALPAFHLVARAFPLAERRVLTNFPVNAKAPPAASILENTGLVDGFFQYTLGTRSLKQLIAVWWAIAKWRPQVLVYMAGTREAASFRRDCTFFRLCGIRRLIGMPADDNIAPPRRLTASELVNVGSAGVAFEHEASRLTRSLADLGEAHLDDPASWDLHLTATEETNAIEILEPLADSKFIAMSLGTKNQSNEWGIDNWCSLIVALSEAYPSHGLVLCGAAVETQMSDTVASHWRKTSSCPAIVTCGCLTPRESAAVIKRAEMFLGHDSGPTHMAAAVQTPCVAVFGARNLPGIWFPYGRDHRVLYRHVECAGCRLQTCIDQGKKCLTGITVEDVFAEVVKLMARKSKKLTPKNCEATCHPTSHD